MECLGISNKSPPTPNLFDEIDTDSSGSISREEIGAWFKAKRGQEELPQGLWENEDKDKDGVISWEEFSGLIYFSSVCMDRHMCELKICIYMLFFSSEIMYIFLLF